MKVELSSLHYIFMIFTLLILVMMVRKRDTSLVCILGIFMLALFATSSLSASIMTVFNSFIYAIVELMGTILIISVIVAMSKILMETGINEIMVSPFTKLIKTPTLAYWIIGVLMMIISFFFWPSPAVALIGAVMLPVAVKVGLPALAVAMIMNIFGHGIALSGDFIIQGAPKLTADAAGLPVGEVISASVPLVIVMGLVTTIVAFIFLKRDLKSGKLTVGKEDTKKTQKNDEGKYKDVLSKKTKNVLALVIPLLFLIDVIIMLVANLQGGDATALIGGTAVFILIVVSLMVHKNKGLEEITRYLVSGFKFGFEIFGPVIPIAAFFYLGDAGFLSVIGDYLPEASQGLVNDLGLALANSVPLNEGIGAVTLTSVGAITGLDGSGFSGISLAGSVARLFGVALGKGVATLTALGQIAAIWVGGGTLIPWAVIPAAAICGVDPFELTRRNFKPVVIGLVVTTIVGMFLI
ncbi:MAG: TRAP transporter large permease subunit [Tissierellaceae bacterium]|jgi:TRAP-type C4-dicarboxylate transport system permease large subunit|nr:TRAP transporter large permease subunit [Tissierellia bacterium]